MDDVDVADATMHDLAATNLVVEYQIMENRKLERSMYELSDDCGVTWNGSENLPDGN